MSAPSPSSIHELLWLIDRAVADGWEHRRACNYLELDEGRAWRWRRLCDQVSPATVRRVLAAHGLVLKRPRRVRSERKPFPEWADYRRNSIWIYDVTHFHGCPQHAVFAVMDHLTRKWITELVSIEQTSTQVQVVFMGALEIEGAAHARRGPPRHRTRRDLPLRCRR